MNENENKEEIEKIVYKSKTKKSVKALLIILIIIVLGLSSYIVYDKIIVNYINNDSNTEEKVTSDEEEVSEDLPEKNSKYTFLESYSQNITLNNKKHTLLVYYYSEIGKTVNVQGEKVNSTHLYKDVYLDNKQILDTTAFSILTQYDDITYEISKDKNAGFLGDDSMGILNDSSYTNHNQYLIYKYYDYTKALDLDDLNIYPYNENLIIVDENANIIDSLVGNVISSWFYFQVNMSTYLASGGSIYHSFNDKLADRNDIVGLYYNTLYDFSLVDSFIYYIDTSALNSSLDNCLLEQDTYTEYKLQILDGKVNKTKGHTFSKDEFSVVGSC